MNRPLDHPLRLEPIFQPRVWGGRRLARYLDRELEGEDPIGESWLLHDRPWGSSRVAAGPWAGCLLGRLVQERGPELLGEGIEPTPEGRFPLLIKLLDAQELLSVQVHPDDAGPEETGAKAEAWVVLEAAPAARVFRGLQAPLAPGELAALARDGGLGARLRSFSVRPGDVVWIPPGTIHALGHGLLLYEVQQNSELTYRLHDWDRPGLDGRPRELHLEQALAAARLDGDPESLHPVEPLDRNRELLVQCAAFRLERWRLAAPERLERGGAFRALTVASGALSIAGARFRRGETALIPAAAGSLSLIPEGGAAELLLAGPGVRP